MLHNLTEFLLHCGITASSLWLASFIFHGISFTNKKSLILSAILLGLANAVIRPVVIVLDNSADTHHFRPVFTGH